LRTPARPSTPIVDSAFSPSSRQRRSRRARSSMRFGTSISFIHATTGRSGAGRPCGRRCTTTPLPAEPRPKRSIAGNMPKRSNCTSASSGRQARSSGPRRICASHARATM
jgi:hypothetical protein